MTRGQRAIRVVITAGVLALFCLFSFGTAKLRARIHQQRRQALVTMDRGDRAVMGAPQLHAPVAVAIVATQAAPSERREPVVLARPKPRLFGVALARAPLRGPPVSL